MAWTWPTQVREHSHDSVQFHNCIFRVGWYKVSYVGIWGCWIFESEGDWERVKETDGSRSRSSTVVVVVLILISVKMVISGSMGCCWFHRVEWKTWLKKVCFMLCIGTSLHASLSTGMAPISWVVLSLNSWCSVLLLKGEYENSIYGFVGLQQIEWVLWGLEPVWVGGVGASGGVAGDKTQVCAIALQSRLCMLVTMLERCWM